MSRFFITTAIDYVNSRPHLGTAYEKISADVIARYKRLLGVQTHFLMGNDEHSQNVYKRARESGLDPLDYCDQMDREFRDVWARLDISFDDFIRTTEERHHRGVDAMVRRIAARGDLYDGFYEGPYCVSCEAFKNEKDLIEGRCPVHGTEPERIKERNHFFRLSRYRTALLEHFERHPEFVQPDVRRNEMLRLLEGGLEDISVSRAGQSWGIPLVGDSTSVVYVWFDALINYLSAVGFGGDDEAFAGWWPADLHVIGKDITRFHTVVWPAMLMSAGLPLPRQVFGHGFVSFKGLKMSKSLGTVLDPLEAAERFGPDPLRLYLVKEIPYGQDGDFSWERFEERYNADLANNLGNLVNRVAAMCDKYYGGHLPAAVGTSGRLAETAESAVARYRRAMDALALHEGAAAIFDLVDATNQYIAETQPWSLARQDGGAARLAEVLGGSAEAVRLIGVMLLPVMPASGREILRRVGEVREPAALRLDVDAVWSAGGARRIAKTDPLWPRLEEKESTDMATDKAAGATPPAGSGGGGTSAAPEQASAAPPAVPTGDERISIDEFMKVDLRVARIVAAERVPNSRKLMKMAVDLGTEQRTLVAGIADAYTAESLVGRAVVVVVNLKPAKLMGIESDGMVLAASPEGGKPVVVGFDEAPPLGSRVR
jgi:methionyl-tRNA synthetase